jgi:hypothetical protein
VLLPRLGRVQEEEGQHPRGELGLHAAVGRRPAGAQVRRLVLVARAAERLEVLGVLGAVEPKGLDVVDSNT